MRPDDPVALADELRPDMLGLWLPLALADIMSSWCDNTDREKILRSWGLNAMADEQENSNLKSFLDGFGRS